LAASVGLTLDAWQAEALEHGMGERDDGKWSAFEVGVIVPRQNGKGAIIEARELWGLFLGGEKLILHSAHEFKTAAEAFRRVLGWIDGSDDLRRRVKRISEAHGKEAIELKSGARLRFVARSKGSGRGFSGDCNMLDEALMLTAEQMAALMPTMSAMVNPQLWYFSTPPLEPAAQLVALRKRGVEGARRLAYFEWSPPDDFRPTPKDEPATDADRLMWASTNPALGIRIAEEFVEAERESLPADEFGRERLGVWPPSADGQWQVVDEVSWRARADPLSRRDGDVAFAVDVTPDRRYTSIGVAGRRADGGSHIELVDRRSGTGWAAAELIRLHEKYKPVAVVLDLAGPAATLLPDLTAAGIEPLTPTARELAQACGMFWDSVCGTEPNLWHLDQPELAVALAGAMKRPLGDAWAWSRRDSTVDLSPLYAVTLAEWAVRTAPATPAFFASWR
jgi:hypothetical protein